MKLSRRSILALPLIALVPTEAKAAVPFILEVSSLKRCPDCGQMLGRTLRGPDIGAKLKEPLVHKDCPGVRIMSLIAIEPGDFGPRHRTETFSIPAVKKWHEAWGEILKAAEVNGLVIDTTWEGPKVEIELFQEDRTTQWLATEGFAPEILRMNPFVAFDTTRADMLNKTVSTRIHQYWRHIRGAWTGKSVAWIREMQDRRDSELRYVLVAAYAKRP